jgi:heterodisulfide reductase subunit B
MQPYLYFPGCSLRTVATDFDVSAKACAHALGTELKEMQGWLCCGAVCTNTSDNLMTQAGPNRILARARTEGNSLVTLCAGCHNVLKRTSIQAKRNHEKQEKINDFNEEETFNGEVNVYHLLEVLRDFVGFDTIKGKIKTHLHGLPVGAYYGCLLLRPFREMQLDDPHRPTVIEDLLESVGCSPIDYPSRTECCGSYLSVPSPETVQRLSGAIVQSARSNGARMIAVSCPLCKYNLELSQSHEARPFPIVYFTQPLGVALGLGPQDLGLDDLHYQAIRSNLQTPMENVAQ